MNNKLLARPFGLLAVLSLSIMMISMPTMAQDEDEDAAELGKIEVTGSRLKQTDIETAQPVTIITREQIELSGFATVSDVLQNTPYNSFGSFKETSGYANGQAVVNEISLRGLGSQRTLVLLDGRRIASTGGSGGAAQNLNQIPLAIIERIEILRDGASAVYGSDAIAGVVNIITRKDFDGVTVNFTKGEPEYKASYNRASITGGVSNSRGSLYYTVQHYDRSFQRWSDVPYLQGAYKFGSYSSWGSPGSMTVGCDQTIDGRVRSSDARYPTSQQWWIDNYGTTNGPTYAAYYGGEFRCLNANVAGGLFASVYGDALNPNTLAYDGTDTDSGGNIYDIFNSNGAQPTDITGDVINPSFYPGQFWVNPQCPNAPGDDPNNPNSYRWAGASATSNNGRCGFDWAAIAISVPSTTRDAALVGGSFDLTPDVEMNVKLLISNNQGESRYAPTPVSGKIKFSADNYYNPLAAYGSNYDTPEERTDVDAYFRTVPMGTRDNFVDEDIQDFTLGLAGVADVAGGMEWEINVQAVNNKTVNTTKNLVNAATLQAEVDKGIGCFLHSSGVVANAQGTALCEGLDLFEVYGPRDNDQMNKANHLGYYGANIKSYIMDGYTAFDIGELAGGPIGMIIGGEYAHTTFDQFNDIASNLGIINGSAGGDNIEGVERTKKSVFFEMGLPFTEEFSMAMAGRYDSYSSKGVGGNFSPHINFSYKPIDWMIIRATYGEGFRVAGFDELFGLRSESYPTGTDYWGCANGVPQACTPQQYKSIYSGNRELEPENSEHYTFGAVISPLPGLSMQLGFWHTEYSNLITASTLRREFQAELDGETNSVERDALGRVLQVGLAYGNYAGVEAEGIDFNLSYVIDTENLGRFDMGIDAAKYTKYIYQRFEYEPKVEYQGGIGLPDLRLNPHLYWGKGDFGASLTGYYIASQTQTFGGTEYTIGSHFETNLQVSYQLPWDASMAIGAINLTAEKPEMDAELYGFEPFDWSLNNTLGRIVYFRYSQSF